MAIRYAVDTNVLLRLSHRSHPQHKLLSECMPRLAGRNVELYYKSQTLGEFWNVSTRTVDRNGFGLSISETVRRFEAVVWNMTLLVETEDVFATSLTLMKTHEVRRTQMHDAHLTAVLEVHGVTQLLTFNGGDFKRFPQIRAVHPQDVVNQP